MRHINLRPWTLLLVILLLAAPLAAEDPEEALAGFDPVLLIDRDQDVLGKKEHAVDHDGLRYLFASAANRDRFLADPARYAIRLGGTCARMGERVDGRPYLFTIHDGGIYVFGSERCLEAFESDPTAYLEPPATPLETTPEARAEGRALIERAVAGLGGAERVDAVDGYRERHREVCRSGGRETFAVDAELTLLLPDHLRQDLFFERGAFSQVIRPDDAFVGDARGSRPMRPAQTRSVARDLLRRDALMVLRRRGEPGFDPVHLGTGEVGGKTAERVSVALDGERLTLMVDPESGRVFALGYRGRDPGGRVGELTREFSDFRVVGGLTLPYLRRDRFSQSDADITVEVESIAVDPEVEPGDFADPATAGDAP